MGLSLDYINGQTPLDEDEKEGLLIPTIATRGELDEFEQQNIEQAVLWSMNRSFKVETVFTEEFLKAVHRRMYGNVWAWAGEFRKTNKNIGVNKWQIPTELRTLLNDVNFWYTHNTYSPDETTIRLKHRLVSIHCFPNGNGRHSRLIADIVIEKIYNFTLPFIGQQPTTHCLAYTSCYPYNFNIKLSTSNFFFACPLLAVGSGSGFTLQVLIPLRYIPGFPLQSLTLG